MKSVVNKYTFDENEMDLLQLRNHIIEVILIKGITDLQLI